MSEDIKRLVVWMQSLETKVQTINERTKNHTIDIRELRKDIKDVQSVREKKDGV